MKHPIRPMLCGWLSAPQGDEPFINKAGTAYELKWDGYRMIAVKEGDAVKLYFRSGNYATAEFPEIVASLMKIPGDIVLDGEVMVLREGSPSFQDLQNRMGLTAARRAADLRYMVYDVLQIGTLDCMAYPYSARREALEKLYKNASAAGAGNLAIGPSSTDGAALWKVVMERNLEGLIAKPLSAPYRMNERGTWVKIKRSVREAFTVVGYTPGIGKRTGFLGAMVVAQPDATGKLVLAGSVGTGFNDDELARLMEAFKPLIIQGPWDPKQVATAKLRTADYVWVEPKLVGVVAFPDRSDPSLGWPNGAIRMASWQAQWKVAA